MESVIDFCERCGIGVFGHKMFNAIVENMENARDRGDLDPCCRDLGGDLVAVLLRRLNQRGAQLLRRFGAGTSVQRNGIRCLLDHG